MCWMMAIPLAISVGTSLIGGLMQSQAAEEEAKAAEEAANFNSAELGRKAYINELQAQDAEKRGEAERLKYMRGFQQEQGTRAAELGASGIEMNSGSALDVLADSAAEAALDAGTIRSNAAREAFGYREQARDHLVSAHLQQKQAQEVKKGVSKKKDAILLNTIGSMAGSMSRFGGGMGIGLK